MNDPVEIDGRLYLGNAKSQNSPIIFEGVVSVMVNPPSTKRTCKILVIPVNDNEDVDILAHAEKALSFIHAILTAGGSVLVHCKQGVSRSSTIVLLYLMKYKMMTLCDAYQLLRERRSTVRPNIGFWAQLIAYENGLFGGKGSVQMITLPSGHMFPSVYKKEFKNMVFL